MRGCKEAQILEQPSSFVNLFEYKADGVSVVSVFTNFISRRQTVCICFLVMKSDLSPWYHKDVTPL